MSTILIVDSRDLAVALRNSKRDHPYIAAILAELQLHGAELHPFVHVVSGVNPLIKFFRINVADDKRADLLRSLKKLPGVNDAYVIPDHPPT